MDLDEAIARLDEFERRDFERQVVCKILRAGGVIGQIDRFVEEHRRLHGTPFLTLDWLRARFPEFPLRLGAVLFRAEPPAWIDMFRHFTQTTVFQAYRQWCEVERVDDHKQAVGLVFNMDGITFVLHNCKAAAEQPARRFVRLLGDPPVAFAFEEFESLLKCLGDDWASGATVAAEADK